MSLRGKVLAASDFFSPISAGLRYGQGELVCEGLNEGYIMALEILLETNTTSSAALTITINPNST